MIHDIANQMNTTKASNREIADQVENQFGIRPSSQLLIHVIGSSKERRLRSINGQQIKIMKNFCTKHFDGSFTDMKNACILARENEI